MSKPPPGVSPTGRMATRQFQGTQGRLSSTHPNKDLVEELESIIGSDGQASSSEKYQVDQAQKSALFGHDADAERQRPAVAGTGQDADAQRRLWAKQSKKTTQQMLENEKQRATSLFNELDKDGSGSLSKSEVGSLAAKMGQKWPKAELDRNFGRIVQLERIWRDHHENVVGGMVLDHVLSVEEEEVQQNAIDEISLPVFLQWWGTHMRWLKREMLKTVNDIFHEIDEDYS